MRTENEIVALGNYVEHLFNEEHFNTLCEEFEQQTVQAILTTAPHEVKAREAAYATIQGKRQLLSLMLAYRDARDDILQQSERTDAPDYNTP